MMKNIFKFIAVSLIFMNSSALANIESDVEKEVADVERAFAKSMADRDFVAFASFLDDEAIFFGSTASRGKEAVMKTWKPFFDGPKAPFAWKPETVLVLDSGNLALSNGPVWGDDGKITSYYQSTWRKNSKGEWKIIFDKGQKYCPPEHEKK